MTTSRRAINSDGRRSLQCGYRQSRGGGNAFPGHAYGQVGACFQPGCRDRGVGQPGAGAGVPVRAVQPHVPADRIAGAALAEFLIGADHDRVVTRRPHRQRVITGGRRPDRAGGPALVVASPEHPADRGVNVVIGEKAHLPGRGQQPPGLIHISRPQVRERLQDRLGSEALPQVILHGQRPDPGARERRGAGMHPTALDHLPAIFAGRRAAASMRDRSGSSRMVCSKMIWSGRRSPSQVPSRCWKSIFPPHGREPKLAQRGLIVARPQMSHQQVDPRQRHIPLGTQLAHHKQRQQILEVVQADSVMGDSFLIEGTTRPTCSQ